MKKRGVSPLIATVLIIAFVIILFSLVTTWVRRAAIEPGMEAGEEKIASALECAEYRIKITNACKSGTNIVVTVDNIGGKDIPKGIKARLIGSTGVNINENTLSLTSLGRTTVTVAADTIGTVTKVEAYPQTAQGICQGELVTRSIIDDTC